MVLLAILLVTGCTVSLEEAEQAEVDIADAAIEVRVTAVQMHDDYEANEVAANLKYDGKVLEVSGAIADIGGGDDEGILRGFSHWRLYANPDPLLFWPKSLG